MTEIKSLQRAYNKAVKHGNESFIYQGSELVTQYAKYLLEHLKKQQKK